MGSLMIGWSQSSLGSAQIAAFMAELAGYMTTGQPKPKKSEEYGTRPSERSWPALIRKAARTLLSSTGVERAESEKLVAYGRRRCAAFMGITDENPSPMVLLQKPRCLIPMLKSSEDCVLLLHSVAQRFHIAAPRLIIRYRNDDQRAISKPEFAYATVPSTAGSGNPAEALRFSQGGSPSRGDRSERWCHIDPTNIMRGPTIPPAPLDSEGQITTTFDKHFGQFAEMAMFRGKVDAKNPRKLIGLPFYFLFGDPALAAIYVAYSEAPSKPVVLRAEEISACLEKAAVVVPKLISHFTIGQRSTKQKLELPPPIHSLKTLATLAYIYESLPGATIALSIAKAPLAEAKWMSDTALELDAHADVDPLATKSFKDPTLRAKTTEVASRQAFEPLQLDRASTFACLAMMETGHINIGPIGLETVMAMSSSDSLFVATLLVNDPAGCPDALVTRIQGNIGRAGISMLIPPSQTVQATESDDWNLVEHATFDGKLKDSFEATSLHLSFTEFSLAIDTGKRGGRSTEVVLLETVISVHDRGRCIADIDVMQTLQSNLLRILPDKTCGHRAGGPSLQIDEDDANDELVTIDSWHEFLDRPDGPSVFRARDNWQARLAAAALSVSRGEVALVFEQKVCWACGWAERARHRQKSRAMFLV